MASVALLYMTVDGQTKKIANKMAECLINAQHMVVVHCISELPKVFDLSQFDAVVLGCSIRYGKHHTKFRRYVNNHLQQLNAMKSYFFSVNLTARKSNRSTIETNPYIKKYLVSSCWKPTGAEVFAGALRYSSYNILDRLLIQLIMKITGGPIDCNQDVEYTDWKAVNAFSQRIHEKMVDEKN